APRRPLLRCTPSSEQKPMKAGLPTKASSDHCFTTWWNRSGLFSSSMRPLYSCCFNLFIIITPFKVFEYADQHRRRRHHYEQDVERQDYQCEFDIIGQCDEEA